MGVRRARAARLGGIDLARAIAMFGMLIGHTLKTEATAPDRALLWVRVWVAPLFVLLAGVGLSLAWRNRRTTRPRAMIVGRACALLLIGLWLATQFYGSILQYAALYMVLGVLVLGAGQRTLVCLSAACLLVGPLLLTYLVHTGTITLGVDTDAGLASLGDPVELLRTLTLEGPYPAVVWSGFFFAGMALGRVELGDRRVAVRFVVVGSAVGLLGTYVSWLGARRYGTGRFDWTHHWTGAAHSESLTWGITAIAWAISVTGATLLLEPKAPRLLAPLVALGQVAVTFYLVHLLYVDTLWKDVLPHVPTTTSYLAATLAFFAVFSCAAWLWRRVFRRGPVEAVIDAVVRTIVRPRPVADARDSALV
jgi:uncharacterized membrane protein YeiB